MNDAIPDPLQHEARAVEAEIRAAFQGVTREGGVSWSESVAIDDHDSDLARKQARAKDTEECWEALVDDPSWRHDAGYGGFNFLDPIGYRYYIAPAMIRCIRERGGEPISYALQIDGDFRRHLVRLIDPRQAAAIARFVRLMIAMHVADRNDIYGEPWSLAYRLYWRDWDRGTALE